MTTPFHRIASVAFNQPLLITKETGETIGSYIRGRIDQRTGRDPVGDSVTFDPVERADGSKEVIAPRVSQFIGEYAIDGNGRPLPYSVVDDGKVAIINVVGELVNRGAWIGASSGLVSYEGIKHQVTTALKDPKVTSVVFDITSPGGEAMGAFELATAIRKLSAKKNTIAVVSGMACSGGYIIASACRKIVIGEDAYAGSIGVLWMHLDLSEYLTRSGIKPTYIFAGAHKVDGNPYAPLAPDVTARIQKRIDRLYAKFVESVALGRPNLSPEKIRATEAGIYLGSDAVAAGLADEVGTFEAVIDSLAGASATASTTTKPGGYMAKKNTPAASVPKAGPGACSVCDCPEFVGESENCGRHSCMHAYDSHADEPQEEASKTESAAAALAGAAQVAPEIAAILAENTRLKAEAAARDAAEATAKAAQELAGIKSQVNGFAAEGKLSGDSLTSALAFVEKHGGEARSDFMAHLANLPVFANPSRIANVTNTGNAEVLAIAQAHGITSEVLKKAATDGAAGAKVQAAVKAGKKIDPSFSVSALRKAVNGK